MLSTQDLKQKEVINIYNGKSLGYIEDISLDLEKGTVEGLVIPQQSNGLFSFFNKGSELVIPWNCVRRVGDEVVLVEIGGEEKLT
ncbi:MAG: YlmC/YmxH family sporulation protein [Firmicutes bacterium]|nr:YlmC/YmxH family sporulation protein [Bacillota bacterium]